MSLSTIDQSTGNPTVISGNVNDKVGNLAALTTTDKSSCVGAINEVNSGLNKAYTFNIDLTDKSLGTNYTVDLPSGFTADNSMIAGISLYKYNNVYSLTSILAESNLYLRVVILSTNKIQYTLQGNDTIAGRLRLLIYRVS